MKPSRKRKIVEIYFILYLAALILLLPNGKDQHKTIANNTSNYDQSYNFNIQSEKSNLSCKVKADSSGLKILDLDSVNTIYYSGDVDDVHFEFIIENRTVHQSLKLSSVSKTSTKYFRIIEDPEHHCAIFYWDPPLFDYSNKLFLVQVFATGKPRSNRNFYSADNENSPLTTVRTQFTLNLSLVNEAGIPIQPYNGFSNPALADTFGKRGLFQAYAPNTGNFSIFPEQFNISKISMQNWSNEIYANNINLVNDLAHAPQISYTLEPDNNNGGFATLFETHDNKLVIQGKTPSYGSMKVFIKIIRKYDYEEYIASFIVTPSLIEQPILPKVIYPEKPIVIYPRLPLSGNATAYLKYGSQTLALSSGGENISFTADISDIGKELVFERYLDGILYGQKYICRVENYPDPEIREIQRISSKEVRVVTRSWGIYKGERNEVVRFNIIEGNAKYWDLRGYLSESNDQQPTFQYFKFVPLNPDKPFEFKIKAVDRRGKVSEIKTFKE